MTSFPKALAFDVFGTVVDWRTSIAGAAAPFLTDVRRDDIDPFRFADDWRARYAPAMAPIRRGERPFVVLDRLHRETLDDLLGAYGVADVDLAKRDRLAHAWRRLDPWPDSVDGLSRLKRRFPVVTLSNGNVALMVALARYAGLAWDAILGAEFCRTYKPDPQTYLSTARALDLAPHELCLVAAHHSDLAAARACGLMTAYVDRPMEYGGRPAPDADAAQDWDFAVGDLTTLADRLGA